MARSPIVARRRLGSALRDLRTKAGRNLDDAARELRCSAAKVSRLETGKGVPRERDVRDLLTYYGLGGGAERSELMQLVDESLSKDSGLVSDFRDVVEDDTDLVRFAALEQDASSICAYSPGLVPGLLQTRGYAMAMAALFYPEQSDAQHERFADFRMRRQDVLRGPSPLSLQVVIGEAALRRPVGGHEVMRDQLDQLGKNLRNGLSSVSFRIAPLSLVVPAVVSSPFSVISFDDDADQDVVYLEGPTGAVYLETDGDVRRYRETFDDLVEACPSRSESLELLEDVYASLT